MLSIHLIRLFFFHFAQRARWAAAIFLRAAADMGLRTLGARKRLSSEASQGRQRRVKPFHFSLHTLSFLLQLPDYSRQLRHSPLGQAL